MTITNESTKFKAVKLAADAELILTGDNECNSLMFVFDVAVTGAVVTESSSTDAAAGGVVPLSRLVFNEHNALMFNTGTNAFTSTGAAVVGYFGSANCDTIAVNKGCVVLLSGRDDAKA